jgi:hypothetical protein
MLMNAASPQKKGDVAKLISPVIPFVDGGYCLTWFYHMFGNIYIGLLNFIPQEFIEIEVFFILKRFRHGFVEFILENRR